MVKAVFVDVDNTLLDFHACAEYAMEKTCGAHGITYDAAFLSMFHRLNDVLWGQVELGELSKASLYAVRWKLIFAALGVQADAESFRVMFQDTLSSAAVPVKGALEMLQYLHGKYTVCIASNSYYDQQYRRLQLAGMYPYVDHLFVSETIGADKPDKAFFEGCFARMEGLLPEETVMIGDSLTADIAGAQNFGMGTVWYDGKGTGAVTSAQYTIHSLDQIRSIL